MSDSLGNVVYIIRNLVTSRVYVGSSTNPRQRWTAHKSQLNRGSHHSIYLQRAWEKYGPDAFVFEIIESRIAADRLLEREDYFHKHFASIVGVYNSAPVAGSTLGLKLGPHSAEHRAKLSASHMGKRLSKEHRAAVGNAHRGKVLSAEHKAALAKAAHERVHKAETRIKLSLAAMSISDETRRKRSASWKASATPERHAAMVANGRNISEETRRKRSESLKKYWATKKQASKG